MVKNVYKYRNHRVTVTGQVGNDVVVEDVKTGETMNLPSSVFMSEEVVFIHRRNSEAEL